MKIEFHRYENINTRAPANNYMKRKLPLCEDKATNVSDVIFHT